MSEDDESLWQCATKNLWREHEEIQEKAKESDEGQVMPESLRVYYAENGAERKRCCCNCGNNIRYEVMKHIECKCAIDGHHIGYVQCFECWCRRWRKERKWDKQRDIR